MKRRPRNEPTTDPHQVARARQAGRALGALLAIYVALAWMSDVDVRATFERSYWAYAFCLVFAIGAVRPRNHLRNISGITISMEATEMAALAGVLLIGPVGAIACLCLAFVVAVWASPQPTYVWQGRQRILIAKHLSKLVAIVGPVVFAGAALVYVFPSSLDEPWPVAFLSPLPVVVAGVFTAVGVLPSLIGALATATYVDCGRIQVSRPAARALLAAALGELRFMPLGALVAVSWHESPSLGVAVGLLVLAFMKKRRQQLADKHTADSILGILAAQPIESADAVFDRVQTVAVDLVPNLRVTQERRAASDTAAVSFPMSPDGDRWLVAHAKPGSAESPRAGDRQLLSALATVAGSVLQTVATTSEALRRARTDGLTGLLNREGLVAALADATATTPAGVVFLDLDGFKALNDTHGHQAGDDFLRHVAQRLRGTVRPDDLVCRLGGDEFVVVLAPCADDSEMRRLTGRLLFGVQEPIGLRGSGAPVQLDASVGAVWCPAGELRDLPRILEQADAAMYRSKRSGRPEFVSLEP